MKIGIMGAMIEEVAGIRAALTNATHEEIGGRVYSSGKWHGAEVVLVFSRWGKVAAASTATTLLDRFAVDRILFVGVAGAVNPSLRIGDVVIAEELLQHDMDASPLPGMQLFEIPLLGRTRFSSPAGWVAAAVEETGRYLIEELPQEIGSSIRSEFKLERSKCVAGLIASGDQFISDSETIARLRNLLPDLLCVEMEGAAVAQICFEFDRPCLVVRVISDSADHAAALDLQRFVATVVTPMTLGIAARIVKNGSWSVP